MFDLLKETKAILKTTPLRWANLIETLSPDLLNRPPAESEWSPVQCLQHIVDTERWVFPARTRAFLAGEDFPGFDPDTQGGLHGEASAAELAIEFAALRAESLALLDPRVGCPRPESHRPGRARFDAAVHYRQRRMAGVLRGSYC